MDIYVCAKNQREDAALSQFCLGYLIRRNCEGEIHHIESPEAFALMLNKNACVSLFMLDAEGRVIGMAGEIQRCNSDHYIILMGTDIRSLMTCVKPQVRPAGLLIKPIAKTDLEVILDEIFEDIQDSRDEDKGQQFVFSAGGEKTILPYRRILYFEAAAKKIVLRTDNQEFEFYGSMQKIAAGLPEYFLRVHRSFIVNMKKVETVVFSENKILLEGCCMVYMSRNSREKVQNYLENRK